MRIAEFAIDNDKVLPFEKQSPEFLLMLGLLRRDHEVDMPMDFRPEALFQRLDWREFQRMLVQHRLVFPVWDILSGMDLDSLIPVEAIVSFRELNMKLRVRQMKLTQDLLEVVEIFDALGIRYLSLKGASLSQRLYGDPLKRHCNDIDLLVERGGYGEAEAALSGIGFERTREPSDFVTDEASRLDIGYHGHYSRNGAQIETHWKLSDLGFADYLDTTSLLERRQFVKFGGKSVCMLSDRDLLSHLTIHGTAHCWNRLKWLYDIASFREIEPDLFARMTAKESKLDKARRAMLSIFFGSGGEGEGLAVRVAVGFSASQVTQVDVRPDSFANVIRRSMCIALLADGLRAKLGYFCALFAWRDCYRAVPLPRSLWFAYVLLGPMYWLWRRLPIARPRGV